MIKKELIKELKFNKNLLAFSAGVDSTALFFILQNSGIEFDIAIVNYGIRKEAKEEIAYAKKLATKYNKKIFIANAPKFSSNFEANAREFRYSFFNDIIKNEGYKTLLTAHQLNDKLEWLLMQLSRGAGVIELSGMEEIIEKNSYKLVRPLLDYAKDELLEYLEKHRYRYFIDSSNSDLKYKRNQFRPIANNLLEFGKSGFKKSFEILSQEADIIKKSYRLIFVHKELRVLKLRKRYALPYAASYTLKELGYLLSGKERETLKSQTSIVAGRKWAIELQDNLLFIAPYIKTTLPKEYKEKYRIAKIPPKVRGYFFKENIPILKFGI